MSMHYTVIVNVKRVTEDVARNGLGIANGQTKRAIEDVINVATSATDPVLAITKAMKLLDVELREHTAKLDAPEETDEAPDGDWP